MLLGMFENIIDSLSEYKFIRTPIQTFNTVCAGGFQVGSIAEIYGVNHAGKSSFCYQTASYFLQDNSPNSFLTIIDCEASTQRSRLSNSFKIDLSRTLVDMEPTLEGAFESISNIIRSNNEQLLSKFYWSDLDDKKIFDDLCNKLQSRLDEESSKKTFKSNDKRLSIKKLIESNKIDDVKRLLLYKGLVKYTKEDPISQHLIIWDTIAGSEPRESYMQYIDTGTADIKKGFFGTTEKPKIIKSFIGKVMASMNNKPITLLVINQASTTDFGSFTGTKITSSGGHALKHARHYCLFFDHKKSEKDEFGNALFTRSEVTIEKSKFSPKVSKILIKINDKLGGVIESKFEVIDLAIKLGLAGRVKSGSQYYSFFDLNKNPVGILDNGKPKTYHGEAKFYNDPQVPDICLGLIELYYRYNYLGVNNMYERVYQTNLINDRIKDLYPSIKIPDNTLTSIIDTTSTEELLDEIDTTSE